MTVFNLSGASIAMSILLAGCIGNPTRVINEPKLTNSGEALEIAFGSCNNHKQSQSYFNNINNHFSSENERGYPDYWIWAGDIVYADTDDLTELRKAYESVSYRQYANFAKGCRRDGCEILGIWDDHDFGNNNLVGDPPSGTTAEEQLDRLGKPQRKAKLVSFLGEPTASAVRDHDQAYSCHDVDRADIKTRVSLLDLRWDRQDPGGSANIMHKDQWAWLEENLADPDVDLHLIVTSTQVLRMDTAKDTWGEYPKERARLLRLLGQHQGQGLILLSGDIHAAEVSRLGAEEAKRYGIHFPLYEITSSGLNRLRCKLGVCLYGWENPYRKGFAAKHNFGKIIAQRGPDSALLVDARLLSTESPQTPELLSKGIRFEPRKQRQSSLAIETATGRCRKHQDPVRVAG